MPSFRQALALSFVALGAVVIAVTASCSNYGEGSRCDVNNGLSGSDSDCSDGLVCTPASALQSESDICCPPDRSIATVAPCTISTSPVADSAAPPATADGSDTGANDTGSTIDASTDSNADTSSSDATGE